LTPTKTTEAQKLAARKGSAKYRASNRAKVRQAKAAYRAANRHKIAAYSAEYRATKAAELRAKSLAYYYANPDKVRPPANPERVRARAARRRTRLLDGIVENFTDLEIFERDGWICGICDEPIDPALIHGDAMAVQLDHTIPVAKGGHHTRANVQASHATCNRRKGDKVPS
jgi:5-methylcytosine-specific restriction endonuclease McrA